MLAHVGRCECEFPLGGSSLGNDAVVVVEHFLHRDEYVQSIVRFEFLRIGHVFFGSVMAYIQYIQKERAGQ